LVGRRGRAEVGIGGKTQGDFVGGLKWQTTKRVEKEEAG